jgi:hypothetical protein
MVALATGLGAAVVLHVVCYLAGLPAGISTFIATVTGGVGYVVMRLRAGAGRR